MRISLPQQARCADRSQATNAVDPARWLLPALPPGWRLHSFHFFVNWSHNPPLLENAVWMTRLLELNVNEPLERVQSSQVLEVFLASEHADTFASLQRICHECQHRLTAIILPEVGIQMLAPATPLWKVRYSEGNNELHVEATTLGGLMNEIQRYSGGTVSVGAKGLIYGTSAVECYLSLTNAAYPGDVDAVIVDTAGHVQCVVEFKKHTLRDPIADHLVTRYYPRPDGRKYQRLDCLVQHYRQIGDATVPFAVLYYATGRPVIRVQVMGALTRNNVTIDRDSGDIDISGQGNLQVAQQLMGWMGITQ